MKQLSQNISTGKASVFEVPVPQVGRGQILVRVGASLVSAGTERTIVEFAEKSLVQKALARPDLVRQFMDKAHREGLIPALESARSRLDSDMVLGYSNAGVVIGVGEDVTEFTLGDRVACAGGGFATHSEIVRVPRNLAAVIPTGERLRDVPLEEAAFATVAAIALQGIRLAELQVGETVAVIGLGLIGQLAVQLARASGCTVIGIDPSHARCDLARRMGCVACASSDADMVVITRQITSGHGADAVLIAAATDSDAPVCLAAEIARDRAKIVAIGAVGMRLPRKPYYMKELTFRVSRSYGPGRYDSEYEEKGHDYPIGYVRWTEGRNLGAVLHLLATNLLDFSALITHRFPIEEAVRAYEVIAGKTGEPFLGVIIEYPNQPSLQARVALSERIGNINTGEKSVALGVLGAGTFVNATMLPAIASLTHIERIGICSTGGSTARSAGQRFGFSYCTSSETEIFEDPLINTVAVCTPHHLHARQVIAALRAGKHVFCEKPLATSDNELAALQQEYGPARYGQIVMVGYNRRYAPLAKRLKQFLEEAAEPLVMQYRVNAGYISPEHWTQDPRTGGGRIIGEVCHFVDFLSFLCDSFVTTVSAFKMPDVGRYSGDNLCATLRFANGSVGTITYASNGDRRFSKERVEVFTQGRVAVLDDFRELHTICGGRSRRSRSFFKVDKGHTAAWQEFAKAVCCGEPSPIAFDQLINGTLTTLALARASSEGSSEHIHLQSHALTSACAQSEVVMNQS